LSRGPKAVGYEGVSEPAASEQGAAPHVAVGR